MFVLHILHIIPNIYLTKHQKSQLLLPFLLIFSARPPKESPAPVITLMVVALGDSSVIIEAMDASILDFLVRSCDIVVSSCACSRFFSWYFLCEPSLSCPWDRALRISSQWGLTDSSIHLWKGYLPIYSLPWSSYAPLSGHPLVWLWSCVPTSDAFLKLGTCSDGTWLAMSCRISW